MIIGYRAERPEGLQDLVERMERFISLANNGWYSDELEEQGRITFKKLGKVFNIKPPVANVDWDKMPDRRGIGA